MQSMKNAQDFQKSARENKIVQWTIHQCSMCDYPCGYIFEPNGDVSYDSGCDCVTYTNIQPCSWEDVASHYNLQTNPQVIEEMDDFWKFQLTPNSSET